MCLIIQTNNEKEISDELFEDIIKRNSDGFGFMWIQNNKIHTKKYAECKVEKIREIYDQTKQYSPYIHFRMKTHGKINEHNTHPYHVGWGIYLMHNGVLSTFSSNTEEESDTWNFINFFLKPLLKTTKNPHKAIRIPAIKFAITEAAGSANRLVLGDRGGFVLLNETQWHKVTNEDTGIAGCLVSNTYAWDAYQFGKPKVVSYHYPRHHPNYKYQYGMWDEDDYGALYPTRTQQATVKEEKKEAANEPEQTTTKEEKETSSPKSEPVLLTHTPLSERMEHWKNNLYVEKGTNKVWMKRRNKWTKRSDLDSSYIDAQIKDEMEEDDLETEFARTFKERMEEYRKEKEDESIFRENGISQDDYERALVNDWTQATPDELCAMVYEQPDDAAIVIYRLAHGL